MTAAIIGFVGVIAGSLITAWFNRRSEQDKRRDEAALAAKLISDELGVAARKLGAYARAKRWGQVRILTDQWIRHGASLTPELEEKDREDLVRAYSLIESWENKRAGNAKEAVAERDARKLAVDSGVLARVSASIEDSVRAPLTARVPGVVLNLGIAALCVVALVLLVAAFVPRAEMTDASIAAALEDQLQGQSYVACSQNSDRWHCDVAYPQQSCQVASPLPQPKGQFLASRAAEPKHRSCGSGPGPRSPPDSYEVAEGPNGPVAMEDLDPDEIVRDEDRAALLLHLENPSEVERAAKELFDSN